MQDDDSTPHLSHIDGPSQATMALHPHLPKLAAKMFDVRLANTINARFLDQDPTSLGCLLGNRQGGTAILAISILRLLDLEHIKRYEEQIDPRSDQTTGLVGRG